MRSLDTCPYWSIRRKAPVSFNYGDQSRLQLVYTSHGIRVYMFPDCRVHGALLETSSYSLEAGVGESLLY